MGPIWPRGRQTELRRFFLAVPTLARDGYSEMSEADFARVLELERRFLGAPELVGAGEQLAGKFRKR